MFTSVLHEAAETLARRGWPVVACHHSTEGLCSCGDTACPSPAKHPRTSRGVHSATVDAQVVRRWWRTWPDANVAVRTGRRPHGAGIVVLDVDPAHGGEASLAALRRAGELPRTLEVTTGGGGRHLYFTEPAQRVPNSVGRLGPGLDVRGEGGYVIAPPSRHVSGRTYRWSPGPLAPMPAWLVDLAQPRLSVVADPWPAPDHVESWAAAALAGEVAAVRSSEEGVRNHTLNRAAFRLGQLVGSGSLRAGDVAVHLRAAAFDAGLSEKEIEATIASGMSAGARHPRHPVC